MANIDTASVLSVMDKKVVAVSPTTSISAAVKVLETSGVDLLPVIDKGKLVGIVSESDLLEHSKNYTSDKLDATIAKVLQKPVFVLADDKITEAIGKVMDHHLTRIPVVDTAQNMKCIGIVTSSELLKASAAHKK